MNTKGIKEFYEVLLKKSSLYNKLLDLRSKYDKAELSEHETLKFITNDIIPLAKSEGFEFSVEDFINYEKNTNNKIAVINDDLLEDVSGGFSGKTISLGLCSLAITSGFIGSSTSFAVGGTDEKTGVGKVTTSSTVAPPPIRNIKKFTPKTVPIPKQDTTSSTSTAQELSLPPKAEDYKKASSFAVRTDIQGEYKYPYRESRGELKWVVLKEGATILDFKKALLEEINDSDDLDTDDITILLGNRTLSNMVKVDAVLTSPNVKNFSVYIERNESITIYTQIQLSSDGDLNDEIESSSVIPKGVKNGDYNANGSRYCFYKVDDGEIKSVLLSKGKDTTGDLRNAIAKEENVDADNVGIFLNRIGLNKDDRKLDNLKVRGKNFKDFEYFNISLDL